MNQFIMPIDQFNFVTNQVYAKMIEFLIGLGFLKINAISMLPGIVHDGKFSAAPNIRDLSFFVQQKCLSNNRLIKYTWVSLCTDDLSEVIEKNYGVSVKVAHNYFYLDSYPGFFIFFNNN